MSIMTIITIAGLRGLPAMAVMGWESIILYLLPAVMFFVPTSLVSAELGATYEGGVYQWVKEGLGPRLGFVAIWMQWIHNVVWYPAQLAFVASAAASVFGLTRLPNSGPYITAVIIVVFWWAVWLTLKGGNVFAKVASTAGLIGTIIPACLLLILGAAWLATGQHISGTLTHSRVMPDFTNFASFALVVQNVLAFAGMEVNAVHAQRMEHPKRYTRVVAIAFASALAIFIIPTLILAMVLPRNVNLSNGTVIAFETMFSTFHIGFMGNVVALAIVFGAIASIISWISGPSRGLLDAAEDGALPPTSAERTGTAPNRGSSYSWASSSPSWRICTSSSPPECPWSSPCSSGWRWRSTWSCTSSCSRRASTCAACTKPDTADTVRPPCISWRVWGSWPASAPS